MSATVSTDFLLLVAQATPEQKAAIKRFLLNAKCELRNAEPANGECGVRSGELKDKRESAEYVFGWTGRDWKVVFEGGSAFYLPDTLGARYLDYLLHHPNQPISAFDLEVVIKPEKAEARCRNSIQPHSDGQARREYRLALGRLQTERQEAREAGDREEVERLESEIEVLESALNESHGAADTGARAYDNVRQAISVVRAQLRKGGAHERAFEAHLRAHLSIGFHCLYRQPEGQVWG
jgi:hypothetical protein